MGKRALFIINPAAGQRNKDRVPRLIRKYLNKSIEYDIESSEGPLHAAEVSKDYFDKYKPDYIVAVGGDGTANEIAMSLVNKKTALGIVPVGSGNGLARFLKISMNVMKALEIINRGNIRKIDVGKVNERPFLCTAGIGFDAQIGQVFASGNIRGFMGYAGYVLKEYFNYQAKDYYLVNHSARVFEKAFLITFANAGQYGNDAYISPESLIDDGYLDMCVLNEFPKTMAIDIAVRLFNRTMHKSPFFTSEKIREIRIEQPGEIIYHLDGESLSANDHLDIGIIPKGLNILAD